MYIHILHRVGGVEEKERVRALLYLRVNIPCEPIVVQQATRLRAKKDNKGGG